MNLYSSKIKKIWIDVSNKQVSTRELKLNQMIDKILEKINFYSEIILKDKIRKMYIFIIA